MEIGRSMGARSQKVHKTNTNTKINTKTNINSNTNSNKYINVRSRRLDNGIYVITDTDENNNVEEYTAKDMVEAQKIVDRLIKNKKR